MRLDPLPYLLPVFLLLGAPWVRVSAQAASAEEEAVLKDFISFLNTPIITASQMLQTARKAPAKVLTITGEEIRARGYTDLEQILHDFSGFNFEKAMGVHWSQIYMRGERSTNSDRFLFIWDGVLQNDIWKQSVWLDRQYPLGNIERIEVMYGPASLLWGTNAISGIINVITRKSETVAGVEVGAMMGPYQTRIVEMNAGQDRGSWNWMLNGRILRSDERDLTDEYWVDNAGRKRTYGLRYPQDYNLPALAANGNIDPDTGRLRFMRNGRWEPFDGRFGRNSDQWFVQAGLGVGGLTVKALSWFRQQAQDETYIPQIRLKETWNPTSQAIQIAYQTPIGAHWESRTLAQLRTTGIDPSSEELTFTRDKPFSASDPELPKVQSLGPSEFWKLHSKEFRFGELLSFRKGSISGVIGSEFTLSKIYESYNSRKLDTQDWKYTRQHSDRNLAVYGNTQVEVADGVVAALGARFDRNWEVGGPGGFGNLVTSRMALIFDLTERQTLKLIAGQAFQDPEAFKKYSTVADTRPLPAPGLKPEKLNSFEVLHEVYSRDTWKTSTSVYFNRVDNKIDLYPIPDRPGANQFQNRGSLTIFGSEFEGRYFFETRRSVFLNLTANSAKADETGRPTGGIAPLQGNLGGDFHLSGGLYSSLRLHMVPSRKTARWDSDSLLSVKRVPGYATVDFSLMWRHRVPGLDLRLSLFNLGNTRYFDPGPRSADGSTYNGAVLQLPFQGYFGVSYRFN